MGDAPIPTHPGTEQHRCEIGPPILAMPISRPGGFSRFWGILIRPRERKRGGVLLQPRRGESGDLQRVERDGPTHLGAMGGTQRIKDVASPVLMQ